MNEGRGFEAFLATRETLAGTIQEISEVLGGLGGGGERARQLLDSRANLLQDAFRLMVVGEFKRGKSTLVNSLLGKDVLPARVAPCTAIITEVTCSIGLAEITYQARQVESFNSHAFEAFAAATVLYLLIGFSLERVLLARRRA
jgi:hypothetical protein